jgi:hypothetical protein
VSEVIRVDPVCGTTVIELGGERGVPIPAAVHAAMERKTPIGREHGEWCAVLDSIGLYKHRRLRPAMRPGAFAAAGRK